MDTTHSASSDPQDLAPRRRLRRWRALTVLGCAAAFSVLVTAACQSGGKSPGVANLSSSPATSASPSAPAGRSGSGGGNGQGGFQIGASGITVAYSQCMRSHGVPRFPDPNAQGQVVITGSSGIDPQSATYQAATNACQKYLTGGGASGNPAQQAEQKANALRYSQCMRAHGIKNFPDPDSDGHISLGSGSGIDPRSSAFQAAQHVCGPIMGANGPTSGNGK